MDLICEIGVNHENSVANAIRMIEEIGTFFDQNSRINLVAKFQAYKADRLACNESPAYWDLSQEPTASQRALFSKFDKFDIDEYQILKKCCDANNVEFMITAFDLSTLKSLDDMVSRHKIASADILNVPLLRGLAKTQKPVLLSTGASTFDDIDFSLDVLSEAGCSDVNLLHCVLNYPTPDSKSDLCKIDILKNRYSSHRVGYSDHTVPCNNLRVLFCALSKGIDLLEKHYTFDKSLQGNDHYHAIDRSDLHKLIEIINFIEIIQGSPTFDSRSNEQSAITNARRSIVASKAIAKGDLLSVDNLTTKRPGTGISSKEWDSLIGKTALRDIPEDAMINIKDLLT